MNFFDNTILSLLSLDIFKQICENNMIPITKLNLVLGVLTKNDVPFDMSFVPGNRKAAASIQLTVHVNPTTTMVFVINLEPGPSVFSPSP
ncbi:MAG: hypothetical protein FWD82_04505 [Defluviitaleaceae bacterium]|nr:hypothetical protein [Defluviitaleaceae bacterium]